MTLLQVSKLCSPTGYRQTLDDQLPLAFCHSAHNHAVPPARTNPLEVVIAGTVNSITSAGEASGIWPQQLVEHTSTAG
jgi:hypothetical protein